MLKTNIDIKRLLWMQTYTIGLYIILDIPKLERSKNIYNEIYGYFDFLSQLVNTEDELIKEKCKKIIKDLY